MRYRQVAASNCRASRGLEISQVGDSKKNCNPLVKLPSEISQLPKFLRKTQNGICAYASQHPAELPPGRMRNPGQIGSFSSVISYIVSDLFWGERYWWYEKLDTFWNREENKPNSSPIEMFTPTIPVMLGRAMTLPCSASTFPPKTSTTRYKSGSPGNMLRFQICHVNDMSCEQNAIIIQSNLCLGTSRQERQPSDCPLLLDTPSKAFRILKTAIHHLCSAREREPWLHDTTLHSLGISQDTK